VLVPVAGVGGVAMTVVEVVEVVTVDDRFVTTALSVFVADMVFSLRVDGPAFVPVISVRMMHVPLMEVVHVIPVRHRSMPAMRVVDMRMIVVSPATHLRLASLKIGPSALT
jgi:hypothetical protein